MTYKFLITALSVLFSFNAFADKIYVDKEKLTLTYYNDNDEVVDVFPVCVGKNYGQKVAKVTLRLLKALSLCNASRIRPDGPIPITTGKAPAPALMALNSYVSGRQAVPE